MPLLLPAAMLRHCFLHLTTVTVLEQTDPLSSHTAQDYRVAPDDGMKINTNEQHSLIHCS